MPAIVTVPECELAVTFAEMTVMARSRVPPSGTLPVSGVTPGAVEDPASPIASQPVSEPTPAVKPAPGAPEDRWIICLPSFQSDAVSGDTVSAPCARLNTGRATMASKPEK